jgi:hypothetical protein
MSFRRGATFNTPEHLRNYQRFMERQVNASENLGIMRAGASQRAQRAFLAAEQVFLELPDRVSRNLFKQLLRRSLKRLATTYKQNWLTHGATHRSYGGQESLRKASSKVIQSMGDTRGLKTTSRTGFRYKRRPRSYIAPIVDSGRAQWHIKRDTYRDFPPEVIKEDLALVIETQLVDLARKARMKVSKR